MINRVVDTFISELDISLLEQYNKATCENIRSNYIYLTDNFKKTFGSKSNFSGFTELLIFKVIEGWLKNDNLNLKVAAGGTLAGKRTYFDKKGNEKIKTQQSDIKIMDGDVIKSYISVKAITIPQKVKVDAGDMNSEIVTKYFEQPLNEKTEIPLVLQDFNRIENVRHSKHSNFNAVTIFYSKPNESNIDYLRKIKKDFNWYNYIFLNEKEYENKLFIEVLKEKLKIK
ncbi:hypothetical protein V4483_15585 [Bacillus paranthracis]|uniref:hypothetical protein n=1 Tax=Bacillus paranthracis TaxID=2026186 RepID=UPI002FCDBF32